MATYYGVCIIFAVFEVMDALLFVNACPLRVIAIVLQETDANKSSLLAETNISVTLMMLLLEQKG